MGPTSDGAGRPARAPAIEVADHRDWQSFFVQVEDGALLHYRTCGKGPAVVLCDGIGCDGFIWPHIVEALRAHHHVIHLHNRGHGRSPRPPDPERLSIDILADDVTLEE